MRTMSMLFILLLGMSACQKEDDPIIPTPTPPIILNNLHLTWTRDWMPFNELSTHTKAVFISNKGKEKRIAIEFMMDTLSLTQSGLPYTAERIRVNYTDNDEKHFGMGIYAVAEYQSVDKFNEFMSVTLGAPSDERYYSHLLFDQGIFSEFLRQIDQLTLAGLTFNNVYADFNATIPPFSYYTEVYYTKELGIVGFQGQNDEFWGLKGYE